MQRDKQFILEILQHVKEAEQRFVAIPEESFGRPAIELAHHIDLAVEAGLLYSAQDVVPLRLGELRVVVLTWAGYDYIELVEAEEQAQ